MIVLGKRVGLSSDEKLEKLFGKYDQYFSSKFRKGSQSNDMYLKRYQQLLTMLILSVPKSKVGEYISKYGDVASLAIEQTDTEKGKDYKELFITEFITTVKHILRPTKELNVKTTGIVTDLGDGEREVNEELVDRLNNLFDSVRDAFEDIDDKKDIYERYTRELESFIMNDDNGGIDSIEFSFELEAYLNTFELIDELNGIRLEKDDLSDDEVSDSMESIEKDISKLLQYDFDIDEDEEDTEDDDFLVEEIKEEVKQTPKEVTQKEEEHQVEEVKNNKDEEEVEEVDEVEDDFGNDVQVVVSKRDKVKSEPKEVKEVKEDEEDYEEEELIIEEGNDTKEEENKTKEVEAEQEVETENEEPEDEFLVEEVEDDGEFEEGESVGSLDDILGVVDEEDLVEEAEEFNEVEDEEEVEIVDEEVGEDEEDSEESSKEDEVFDVTQFLKSE